MASIHLMVGIQGSGKSILARALCHGQTAIILEPDAFRWVLCGDTYNTRAEDVVWAHITTAARAFLYTDHSIIIDATNIGRFSRTLWVRLAQEETDRAGATKIYAHVILTPLSVALDRNANRSHPVDEKIVKKYAKKFEMPTLGEGFHYVYIYNQRAERIGHAGGTLADFAFTENYRQLVATTKVYSSPRLIEDLQTQETI